MLVSFFKVIKYFHLCTKLTSAFFRTWKPVKRHCSTRNRSSPFLLLGFTHLPRSFRAATTTPETNYTLSRNTDKTNPITFRTRLSPSQVFKIECQGDNEGG
jgi:hypothetical protein